LADDAVSCANAEIITELYREALEFLAIYSITSSAIASSLCSASQQHPSRWRPARSTASGCGASVETRSYVVDLTGRKPARIRTRSGGRLSARSKAFSPIQNNSDLAQGLQGNSGELLQQSKTGHVSNLPRPWRSGGQNKKIDARSTLGFGKLEDRAMSISDDVQKRNAFAACAEFRIEGLEASLHHAREIAVREELGVVGHYIAEAQGYLAQIRLLHQAALDEFSRAQGE
jgi:hypothetical protein